jgi:hypothetical protein
MPLEPPHDLRQVGELRADELDGHGLVHEDVGGAIDRPHSTGSDLLVEPVAFSDDEADVGIRDPQAPDFLFERLV